MAWANYGWEVIYEIWEIPGEQGDWYYHGQDGPDIFFTIECNPFGPYIGNSYKDAEEEKDFEVLSDEPDVITIRKEAAGMELIIKYQKKVPAEKSEQAKS